MPWESKQALGTALKSVAPTGSNRRHGPETAARPPSSLVSTSDSFLQVIHDHQQILWL